jgi:hypothetical protein
MRKKRELADKLALHASPFVKGSFEDSLSVRGKKKKKTSTISMIYLG